MNPIVIGICAAFLIAGALLALWRVEKGPSILDRIVGIDVLVAALIGCLALISIWFDRTDLVLVLMVLALVGFVGSVTLARFAAVEPEEGKRILTPKEAAEADARERFEDEIRAQLEREEFLANEQERAEAAHPRVKRHHPHKPTRRAPSTSAAVHDGPGSEPPARAETGASSAGEPPEQDEADEPKPAAPTGESPSRGEDEGSRA